MVGAAAMDTRNNGSCCAGTAEQARRKRRTPAITKSRCGTSERRAEDASVRYNDDLQVNAFAPSVFPYHHRERAISLQRSAGSGHRLR
jgi:hypothetical protein